MSFQWIKKEFRHILPVFLFFFIAFNLINWIESFLLKRSGIEPFSLISIAIGAALVAKIFLVADHVLLNAPVKKKPLIYLVVWKTILYWAITGVVRLLIRLTPFLFLDEGMSGDLLSFFQEIDWHLFAAVQSRYLMLLFLYVTARELARVIAEKNSASSSLGNRSVLIYRA